jgi:hypothetical protein
MENLFEHPRIAEHFAGRDATIDVVLADLHHLGEVGVDVHAEDGDVLYTCTLVLRTGEGSVVVTDESVLGAALGCLLETLLELHQHAEQGFDAVEDFLSEN